MKSGTCNVCHSDRDDGTFGGIAAFNVNDLQAVASPTQATLASYIETAMPQGSPGNCDADCAADVAAYLWTYKRTNLITDGGFEGATLSGWQTWNSSTLALSTTTFYSGGQSLAVTNRPNTGQYAVFNVTSLVDSDTTYAVRAQARHAGAGADTLRLAAKVECDTPPEGHNGFPWIQNLDDVPANQWTLLTGNLVIPACDPVDVAIYFEGTSADVNVFLDEVYLVPPGGAAEPEPQENLLDNGDFETDTAGWNNFGSGAVLAVSATEAHAGSQSLHVDRSGHAATGGYAATTVTGVVTADTAYTVSARVKHKGAGADTLRMAAVVQCETPPEGHNTYPWLHNLENVPADQWTLLTSALTLPACNLTQVTVYFEGTAAGVDVYIDSVSITAD